MTTKQQVKQFWDWFQQNQHKYLFLSEISDEQEALLMNAFLIELHKFCDELYFEIGGHPNDDTIELVITAEGILENFEKVELLIDSAPVIKGWNFIKFKQAHGPGFVTNYEGIKFDPNKIIYIPLNNESNPDLVGIKVCYADLTDENIDTYRSATYVMLDTLLGEYSVATDLDYIGIVETPADITEYDFGHLSDIAEYIQWKKSH